MKQFFNVTRYEFSMSIRRAGFWITYVLLGGFYLVSILIPAGRDSAVIAPDQIWPEAGHLVFMFNIFLPLLAGLLSADRMQRDFRNGVRELQRSSPLSTPNYILAKYLGVLISTLLPFFLILIIAGLYSVFKGLAPWEFLWPLFVAFLAIALPAHAFVVAFSLACPLVMPLRVYQVLFTGYWFWGNLLSPKAFPTISDTVLNAVGQIPLQAYFSVTNASTHPVSDTFTRPQAMLNVLVLTVLIAAALSTANAYLRWQARRA
ncbi:ABC-2 family transporter protein [Longilinea arvoryzae]|uniref:ABC-2 family transporter protein n=1 Tax=Longilinea arvoryzae TaxID=360412 RepID=A0A0S7BG71_9CHLR|nr:ABC-2 transporter permease [Longilinea arvoryzae]GAP12693.1 ABC-2 family transporter protein [Longilinea arvoryzae]